MLKFVKKTFISAMKFFSCNLPSITSLSCISMHNQACQLRPEIVNC